MPKAASRQFNPIPANLIDRLEQCIDLGSQRDIRDLALVTLFIDTLVRPAEVLGIHRNGTWVVPPVRIDEVTRSRDGSGRLAVRCLDSRKIAPTQSVHVSARCMKWIDAWLSISGLESGALFRCFRYQTSVRPESAPYSCHGLPKTLRRLRKLAGIRHHFSTACLRAYTANQMLECGIHMDDVRVAVRSSHIASVCRLHAGILEGGASGDVLRRFEQLQRRKSARGRSAATAQLELPGF